MVLRIRNPAQGGNLAYTLGAFQQTYAEASGNLETDPMFTDEANRGVHAARRQPGDRSRRSHSRRSLSRDRSDLGVFERDVTAPRTRLPPRRRDVAGRRSDRVRPQ